MRRIVMMVSVAIVASALTLVLALPALAAPPAYDVLCTVPEALPVGRTAVVPQEYKGVNDFARLCKDLGGTVTKSIITDPGSPTG